MAKRDVELVIRAREEAANAVNGVAAALEKLDAANAKVAQSSGQTASQLDKIKTELEALSAKAGALNAMSALTKQFADADKQVKKLEESIAATEARLQAFKNAPVGDKLTTQIKAANTALDSQKVKLQSAQAAFSVYEAKAAQAQQNVARAKAALDAAQTKLSSANSQPGTKTAEQMASLNAALDTQKTKLAQAEAAFATYTAKTAQAQQGLARLQSEIAGSTQKLTALQSTPGSAAFTRQIEATTASLAGQRTQLEAAKASLASLAEPANRAAASLGLLDRSEKAIATETARVSGEMAKYKTAIAGLAPATASAANATNQFAQAQVKAANASRTSLDLYQRIRGQVLSLISAYGGLFAVQGILGGVVDSIKVMDQAQARMSAAFKGNGEAINTEMKFIEQTAQKLGLSFASLSDGYSKFLIAGQQSNVSLSTTRELFTAVATAARVNKLSMEQQNLVFLALTQIMSKGKFTAEEVSRQLGDVLPGAVKILQNALGLTGEEYFKLQQKGELLANDDTLSKFAKGIQSAYGPGLEASLASTTTAIQAMGNAGFDAYRKLASGGLDKAIGDFARLVTAFVNSKEGTEALTRLGGVAGEVLQAITGFLNGLQSFLPILNSFLSGIQNVNGTVKDLTGFNLLGIAVAALAIKFSGLMPVIRGAAVAIVSLVGVFRGTAAASVGMNTATGASAVALRGVGTAALTVTNSMSIARAELAATAGAARIAGISFGAMLGPIGLLITAVSLLAPYFLDVGDSSADASVQLEEHKRIVTEVGKAYSAAKGDIEKTKTLLEAVTVDQANSNFLAMKRDLADTSKQFQKFLEDYKGYFVGAAEPLQGLIEQFQQGKLPLDEFIKKVREFNAAAKDDESARLSGHLLAALKVVKDSTTAYGEAAQAAKLKGSALNGLEEAAKSAGVAVGDLAGVVHESGSNMADAAGKATKYADAMEELRLKIPGVAEEIKKLKDLNDIDQAVKDAQSAASSPREYINAQTLGNQAKAAISTKEMEKSFEGVAKSANITKEAVKFIAEHESFRSKAYDDNGSQPGGTMTIGYGHTAGAGGIKPVDGMVISQTEGLNQLAQDLQMFTGQVRALVKVPITDAMEAALVSYQYNTGKLAGSEIIKKLNAGNYSGAQQAIRDGIKTSEGKYNKGLDNRRNAEADLFGSQGMQGVESAKKEVEAIETKKKAQEDFNKLINDQNAATQFSIDQLGVEERQRAINAKVHEAELAAKEKGLSLSQQQRAEIEQLAAAEYDAQNKGKIAAAEKEAVEKRVNDLLEQRKMIQEQITFAQQQGDTGKAADLQTKLTDVDAQLQQALESARAFWQGVGGPEADTALLKLDGVANSVSKVKTNMIDAGQISSSFVDGLSGAFSSMASNIADWISGVKSGKEALKGIRDAFLKFAADFLLQMGQMIIKQTLMNALSGGGGGGGGKSGGGIFGFLSGLFHEGSNGPAGESNSVRLADPAWFKNARRFHTGKFAAPGLNSTEMAAVIKKNETVLTPEQLQNVANGNSSRGTTVINAVDGAQALAAALGTPAGEKVIINHIRANKAAFNAAMG